MIFLRVLFEYLVFFLLKLISMNWIITPMIGFSPESWKIVAIKLTSHDNWPPVELLAAMTNIAKRQPPIAKSAILLIKNVII